MRIGDGPTLARVVLYLHVVVELVWDSERVGTAIVPSGATLRVGDDAAMSPDDLIAMSASACLMRTFLALAAQSGARASSYASTATFDAASAGAPRVIVHAYVVAPTPEDGAPLEALFAQAQQRSTICHLLGSHLTATVDVRTVRSDGTAT